MRRLKITRRQERFIEEYLIDLNATQAAIRAGYKPRNADIVANQLIGKTLVADAIKRAIAKRSKRTGVTADRVVRELARVAFADMKSFTRWGKNGVVLVPDTELSEDDSAAVSELVQTTTESGGSIRIKLHSKIEALKELAKHSGVVHDGESVVKIYLPDNQRESEVIPQNRMAVAGSGSNGNGNGNGKH